MVSRKDKAKFSVFAMLIVAAASIFFFFPRITIPLLVSYILTLVLLPVMHTLVKMGLSRVAASSAIVVGLLFFSVYPIVKIAPMISNEAQNVQYYVPKVEKYLTKEYFSLKVKLKEKTGFEVEDHYMTDLLKYLRSGISSLLLNLPKLLASLLEWFFIIPLFIFFLLKDLPEAKKGLLRIIPNTLFEKIYFLFHKFNKQLGGYILAKFIEASILGLIITSGLLIIDVRFALIFGLVAMVTNVIPYLGPVFGTLPAIIFVAAEYGFGGTFGAVAILYLIANAIDIAIVFPILVSKIVDLHPVIVVASVILGSQLMGTIGMVISIPAAAAVKLIFLEIFEDVYLSSR
jgi:putative permease